jgi:hypothetical protein
MKFPKSLSQLHSPALRVALVSLLLATLVGGCAEERPPIDRVQPLALEKAFYIGEDFEGSHDDPEFWAQNTLIDVDYGAAQSGLFTSTYAQPMTRVKWEITEALLIARLAYERIDGTDGKGVGGPIQDGVVVAAFGIEKHFDIQQAYNPTTGEKLNILEENAIDRPWYERAYFRVDFSKNKNTDNYDFDTLSMLGVYGGVQYESLAYYVEKPSHPHAPFFDNEKGYFDITTKAFAKPAEIDLSFLGWGIKSFPSCWLDPDFLGGSGPAGSCSPVELTLRHSFRLVVDNDYTPKHWDGYRFQAYGVFDVKRSGYIRNYGMSDDLWHFFVARYPIWERSHYYDDPVAMTGAVECYTPETTPYGADPNRDLDENGTEDECEAVGNGSRCDIFSQKCSLPFQERQQKPVVWYYTEGSNRDYFGPTDDATQEWDVAMRHAVETIKYAECQAQGGEDCASKYAVYFGQQDDNVDAVALAREVDDCRNGDTFPEFQGDGEKCRGLADSIGAARGYSEGVINLAKTEEMVILCHSPVEADDHPACGADRLPADVNGEQCYALWSADKAPAADDFQTLDTLATCNGALRVRPGDLRYHQVNVLESPQTPSPWGIYTDAEDPLTGETVSASINVWSHVNDLFAQGVVDKIRYIAGELSTEDVTEGENVRNWAEAAQAAMRGGTTGMTREERDRRIQEYAASDIDGHKHVGDVPVVEFNEEIKGTIRAFNRELSEVKAKIGAASAMSPVYAARRKLGASAPGFEAQLMTPMIQELHGVDGMEMGEAILNHASPLRGGNPSSMRDMHSMREVALAERGACILHEAPTPLALTSLSRVMEEKFGEFNAADSLPVQAERAAKMHDYIRRKAHYAVIVHEMGHSIGMRHNFVSSSDAMWYRPQYWQLRTKDGTVDEECQDLVADGSGCIGPRYFDPMTDEEEDNMLWMFMHSSVMDYAGELTQDMLGLGAYDFAAPKMFYGDTVAVFADESFKAGTDRGTSMLNRTDTFGGILGIASEIGDEEIHYSALQKNYDLIQDCQVVDIADFVPSSWDVQRDGKWHPVLDGLIVKVDGEYTRCRQQTVDYAMWDNLRDPKFNEVGYYRGSNSIDDQDRIRVPYGFGTDGWADVGNLAVYRHDNGADAYELFSFFIAMQEVNHIFDAYRRGRQGFSIRGAVYRTLRRFNEKMRDGAKGMGLFRNIYAEFAAELGYNFDDFWPSIASTWFKDNILASGMAFDHFTRQAQRPESGNHYYPPGSDVLHSARDTIGQPGTTQVVIPNGATGYYGDFGIGGKLVENQLADDKGEFDSWFTQNAGSYYEKIFTGMLLTESVDNFISDSRQDFVDARYRAVSMADMFPDGYRRFLGNMLTNDKFIKGARIGSSFNGKPETDGDNYPAAPMAWTSWWGDTPRHCAPADGSLVCETYGNFDNSVFGDGGTGSASLAAIDPQIGWEQQKFLIAYTLLYLPENQRLKWLDMLRIWEIGPDSDPGFEDRIEFHHPSGKVYIAKTNGREDLFGKSVERGIAGRVLDYANELLEAAYIVDDGPDHNGDGVPDWYIPIISPETGTPIVKWDPTISAINEDGFVIPTGSPGCDADDSTECTCAANRACIELQDYVSVPAFMREAFAAYHLGMPGMKGVW